MKIKLLVAALILCMSTGCGTLFVAAVAEEGAKQGARQGAKEAATECTCGNPNGPAIECKCVKCECVKKLNLDPMIIDPK